MNKRLHLRWYVFTVVLFYVTFLNAQWSETITFNESAFPSSSTNLISIANSGPFIAEYDVVTTNGTCGGGNEYVLGTDGTNDIRVTATLVTSPGITWSKAEGDYSTVSTGSFSSDYNTNPSRPNDFAYVKYDFEFIGGLENNVEAAEFSTDHLTTNGSSEAYEWTQVTLNGASINEGNIGNYTNEIYSDITMGTPDGDPYPNGRTISEFLSGQNAGDVAPGGRVMTGWWAIDDFNTTILAGSEMDGTNPGAGNGSVNDDQVINGATDFGLGATDLVTSFTYYFGLTDVAFDTDGDGNTRTNTIPIARVRAITIGSTCAVVSACPAITAVTAPSGVCQGAGFDVSATGLADMDDADNGDTDFGVAFTAFAGMAVPSNAYTGGTALGTLPFANLTGGGTTAELTGVGTTLAAGNYQICAVLTPGPTDATCRPQQCTAVTINALPTASIVMNNSPTCSGTDAVFTVSGTNGSTLSYNTGGATQTLALDGTNQTITVSAVTSDVTLTLESVETGGTPNCMTTLSATSTVNINTTAPTAPPTYTGVTLFCLGETVQPIVLFGDAGNTFEAYSDINFTVPAPGTLVGNEYTMSLTTPGLEIVYFTQVNADGCKSPALGLPLQLLEPAGGVDVDDIAICGTGSTEIVPTALPTAGGTTTMLLSENFEGTPTYTAVPAESIVNTTDYFSRTDGSNIGGTYNGQEGLNYFAAQDVDEVGALPATLSFTGINITGVDNIQFSALFAEDDDGTNQDWDSGDFLHINYSIDGGADQPLLWVEATGITTGFNAEPSVDTNFDGVGDGIVVTNNFQTLTAMTAVSGSTLDLTIEFNLNSGEEDIAIDDIMLTGTSGGGITYNTFNFYSDIPPAGFLAGVVPSYDPMTPLGSTETYYVTNINPFNGCESDPEVVTVSVFDTPAAPGYTGDISFCDAADLTSITATGEAGATFNFYADAGLTTTAPGTVAGAGYTAALTGVGTETVYITQTVDNCESPATAVTIEVVAKPAAPTVMDITVCEGQSTEITPGGGTAAPITGLIITGAYDGPLNDGTPKGVELYVISDIADLSEYGLGSANNGGDTDGEEFTFPAVPATAGSYIYVASEGTEFANFFGFAPDYTDVSMNINGDDAIELFQNGAVVDVFGDINMDGTGEPWDHVDGWAYRNTNAVPGGTTFTVGEWTFSGTNALDNETSNATAATPFPIGTYTFTPTTSTAVYNFYDMDPAVGGVTPVAANVTSYTPAVAAGSSVTIYVTEIDPITNCEGDAAPVTVSVSTDPIAAIFSANGPFCAGGDAVFAIIGTGGATLSYDVGNGTETLVLNGGVQNLVVPMATSDVTLSLISVETGGTPSCLADLSGATATVFVNAQPPVPTVMDITVCEGQSTEITPGGGTAAPTTGLILTGAYDGPLNDGTPKGVELYVISDIADLSEYGLGSANNGGDTDGEEFTFPAVPVTAGSYIYVASEEVEFTNFFGFAPDYTDGSMAINGDDAIELFQNGAVVDVFGDINMDGTGEPWDHVDGWAYRNTNAVPGGTTFTVGEWTFSGTNALDDETSNATAATPFPIGTYTFTPTTSTAVYNFYDMDPTTGATPVAGTATSYIPVVSVGTTVTIFVTEINPATGCEGEAAMVNVTVNPSPAAPGFTGMTTFCTGDAITPITASGDAGATFNFYADAALTTTAPGTANGAEYLTALTAPGSETVYITQASMDGCESPTTEVMIEILPQADAPNFTGMLTFCDGETITPITVAGNNIQFFGDAALTTSPLGTVNGNDYTAALTGPGTETVYFTQEDGNSCTSAVGSATIEVYDLPDSPVFDDVMFMVCEGESSEIFPALPGVPSATVNVINEDFEGTMTYTTSVPEFSDGGNDYFINTDGSDISGAVSLTNVNGRFFAAQDLDGDGQPNPSSLSFTGLDISGLTNLAFSVSLAEDDDGTNQDWDAADFVHIDYAIDGGAMQPLLWVEADIASGFNGEPRIDSDFDMVGDGTALTDAFQTFTAAIAATGSTLDLTITISLDSGDEDIAIDDILLTGDAAAAAVFNFYDADPASGTATLLAGGVASYDPMLTPADGTQTIYVTYTDANGCESVATPLDVSVKEAPDTPTVSATGNMTFDGVTYLYCEDVAGLAFITCTGEPGATFVFYGDAGLTTPAPGTVVGNTYFPARTTPGTETVWIAQVNANGCQTLVTEALAVIFTVLPRPDEPVLNPQPLLTASATSAVELCIDGDRTFTVAGDPANTFQYYADAALTMLAPGDRNGNMFTVPPTPAMQTIYVTQTDPSGCVSTALEVHVEILPRPDMPTVADITTCEGGDTEIFPSIAGSTAGPVTVYSETFDGPDFEGIGGACSGSDPATCNINNPPANGQWSIVGDASGLTATSDFFDTFGGDLDAQDLDEELCFLTSMIDITGLTNVAFSVDISESGGHEPTDYVDVSYIVDGTSTLITNWNGLGDATHTLIDDFNSTNVTADGIMGADMQIQICVLNNAGNERISIDNVIVTGTSSAAPVFDFYDNNPAAGSANLLADDVSSYDPMTTAAGSPQTVWVTYTDANGCVSEAAPVTVTVNALPTFNITLTNVQDCPGDLTGRAIIIPLGTPPLTFTYATTNGAGLDSDGDGNQITLGAGDYTFELTDGNGCTTTGMFTIADAVDTAPPMITCPAEADVNCGESTLPSATGTATATDNCTTNPSITYVDALNLDGCGGRTGTIARTFTATDESGNTATCVQTINIIDDTPPTFDVPMEVTIDCSDNPDDLTLTGEVSNLADNCTSSPIISVWINELHYDNVSGDVNEGVEIAGTAGLDISGYQLVFYNGSNGTVYLQGIIPGGTVIDDEGNGYGALDFPITSFGGSSIQNGSPDGVALIDAAGGVVEFISYEGEFTAVNGPAAGVRSTDIGVNEGGATPANFSLQRIGTGTLATEFTWTGPLESSFGDANAGQTFVPITFDPPTFTGYSDEVVADPNCPTASTITRTFTVTDACGNTATATQVINVQDITAPVPPTAPADIDVQCSDEIPLAPTLAAMDACGGEINAVATFEITNQVCATRFTYVRTFTFDDGCGNVSSISQNINVIDSEPLVVAPMPSRIVDCEVNVIPQPQLLQVTTSCDSDYDVTSDIQGPIGEPGCPGTLYNIVYTISDDCGRTATVTQQYTIQNDGPEFVCPTEFCIIDCDDDLSTLQAKFNAYADNATVNTSCVESEVTITNNFNPNGFINNDCGSGTIAYPGAKQYQIVNFVATDACNRSTNCTALVIIVDDENPTINGAPYTAVRDCGDDNQALYDDWAQNQFANLNAVDNCTPTGQLSYTYTPSAPNEVCDGDVAVTYVTFTVADECGNYDVVQGVFKLRINPPMLSELPDITVPCDDPLPAFDTPTVSGACGATTLTFVDTNTPDPDCPNAITYTRVYTVTDGCGNTATASQSIFTFDDEAPVTSDLPDLLAACDEPLPDFGTPTATDNCGVASVVSFEDISSTDPDCPQGMIILRTFVVSDECGNTATARQRIVVTDNEAPVTSDLPDLLAACDEPLPDFGTPMATDNCGVASVVSFEDISSTDPDCPQGMIILRTFVVSDECGNTATARQRIVVTDGEAPVFTFVPANSTGECSGPIVFEDAQATDNCGTVNITFEDESTINSPCDQTITRTWTATDECGNAVTASATISIIDNEPPVAMDLPDILASCDEPMPDFGTPTATDNCGTASVVSFEDISAADPDCPQGSIILRTFTIADECGNTTTARQRIIISDSTAPTFTFVPSGGTVDCDAPTFSDATATDNCGAVTITFEDSTAGGGCNGGSITRTWTATDECGNTATASASFTINDDQPPVFTYVPPTPDVDCDQIPDWETPIAEDNCGDVSLTFVESIHGTLCDAGYSWKRVWTATDECGNTATVETAIWVNPDNQPPVFTYVPPTPDVDCDQIPDWETPIATDNCTENVTLTFEESIHGTLCDAGYSWKRLWTATDDCGNTAQVETAIWVNPDIQAPIFVSVPADGAIDCASFPPTFGEVVVEEACGNFNLSFVDEYVGGDANSCANGDSFTYRRTWTATDDCGNASVASQSFLVTANGPLGATISGSLSTEDNEMVDQVMMELASQGAPQLQEATEGTYVFGVELFQNYELTPTRNDNHRNGVSTFDLLLLKQHLLGIQELDSPYQLIAADVNNTGTVTSLDMIGIRRMILLLDDEFENNTSWRFVESEFVFPDPTNPFVTTFPEVSTFNGIEQSEIQDYVAIKIGDLNGSATPNQLALGDTRSADGELGFVVNNQTVKAGQRYEVAFKARDFVQIFGYQYSLNLGDAIELIDIHAGALKGLTTDNFGLAKLSDRVVTTSWANEYGQTIADDEVLFTIEIEALRDGQLSDLLHINSRYTAAEAYSMMSDKMDVTLRFEGAEAVAAGAFELYQNRPNPFRATTTIGFNLPEAGTATLTIFDVAGRMITQIKRDYDAGYNEEVIERSDLGNAGVLYYQLKSDDFAATKKMILVK